MFYLSLLYGLSFATQHIDSCINFEKKQIIVYTLRLRILLILKNLLRTFSVTLKSTMGVRLKTKYYHTRKGITFPKFNSPFISSNISTSPADRVYISQLIHYIYIELVPSTVNYKIVITIWLTATKYQYIK